MAQRHRAMLAMAYRAAAKILPPAISSIVSKEKVENVVKPPQSPVLKKSTTAGCSPSKWIADTATSPMMKAPRKFISSVAAGKFICVKTGSELIKYLSEAPIKPPIPTAKKLNMA